MIKEFDKVTILTILLFGLPVLLYALKLRLFNKFNFDTLTKAFNTIITIQSSSSSSSSSIVLDFGKLTRSYIQSAKVIC
jgi:hypothetical protein